MSLSSSASGSMPQSGSGFELRGVGRTHPGMQRDVNEDAFYVDDVLGLYLVCDGMGGHASGQIASDLAVRTAVQVIKTGETTPVPASAAASDATPGATPLVAALRAANSVVFQRSQADPACRGMGTTAVGIQADGDILHACHIGDSRLYRLRGGEFTPITRDHSLVNLYKDRPELTGQLGPATSNVIIRAVGLEADVEVEHRTLAMEHGDVYLLCCDGLTDLVQDWMIKEIMTSGETAEVVADNLVRAANANGGTDNITVVVVSATDESQLVDASGTIG